MKARTRTTMEESSVSDTATKRRRRAELCALASTLLDQADRMTDGLEMLVRSARQTPLTAEDLQILERKIAEGRESLAAQRELLGRLLGEEIFS